MASVFAHESSDIKPQIDIPNELDVNLLLRFSRVRFPRRVNRTPRDRTRDDALLQVLQKKWPAEYVEKLQRAPVYNNGRFRLNQFTIQNLRQVMLQTEIPMTQKFLARYNAITNPTQLSALVKADSRKFNAQLIADPAQPTILRFVACMNKAVQMMSQSLGHFRLGIKTLVEYWAERDFISYNEVEDENTWEDIRLSNIGEASRKVQLEHTVAKQILSGFKKLQKFNRRQMLNETEWDERKTNALQYFWIAMHLLKECLENPPDPVVSKQGGSKTFQIPNPERVEFNRLLYANIGYSIPDTRIINNRLFMKKEDGSDCYYDVYDINEDEYNEDAKAFIRNNFYRQYELMADDEYEDNDIYIGGYFGYKFKDGLSFFEAEPFMPRSVIVRAMNAQPSRQVGDRVVNEDLAKRATLEAVQASVFGDANTTFNLTPLPRGRALKGAIEDYFLENDDLEYTLKGEPVELTETYEIPDNFWVQPDSMIRIGDDARKHLQYAVRTLQDSAPQGPNNPPWLQFKPSNTWNEEAETNVVFGNTPSLDFPEGESFKDSIRELLDANIDEQQQLFVLDEITYQYGAPAEPEVPQPAQPVEGMTLRSGVNMDALPSVHAQMARIAGGDMTHAGVIDLLVSPQEVNDYLDANLHNYQSPDHRLVRQFAHKMGWREGGVIPVHEKQ